MRMPKNPSDNQTSTGRLLFICRQITKYMVVKQAVAPITWLASSAQKTP